MVAASAFIYAGYPWFSAILALISGVAFLAKSLQGAASLVDADAPLFLRLSHKKWFVVLQFLAFAVLLLPAPVWLQASGALFVAIVVVAGQVMRVSSRGESCDCFGSMTPQSGIWFALVTLVALISAACVGYFGVTAQGYQPSFSILKTVLVVVAMALIAVKLKYDEYTKYYHLTNGPRGEVPQSLRMDLELGAVMGGGVMAVADVPMEKGLLLVGISVGCGACHRLYDDIVSYAANKADGPSVIVIANDQALLKEAAPKGFVQLVDSDMKLGSYIRTGGTPFAVFTDSHGELLAPVTSGREQIRALLGLATKLSREANGREVESGDEALAS